MKNIILGLTIGILLTLGAVGIHSVFAEQSGSTPSSGVTSYLKSTYDSITTLGHGSTSSGSWGNWGAMWNRIRSAAEWTPDAGLDPSEVLSGETFYSGSRSAQTGDLSFGYGDWAAKDVNTIYQADEDGLVVATISVSSSSTYSVGQMNAYTDENETPITTRAVERVHNNPAKDIQDRRGSITLPVRAGDYWKIEALEYIGSFDYIIYWIPLGL